MQPQGRQRFQL